MRTVGWGDVQIATVKILEKCEIKLGWGSTEGTKIGKWKYEVVSWDSEYFFQALILLDVCCDRHSIFHFLRHIFLIIIIILL